ncbi:MAG: hypothetical protein HC871_12930 [Rhizobiales bacterium]|nr:hypothetical protein [Hyphomicrobiales bacterium]
MALIYANKSALKAALISWMADGNLDADTLDRSVALAESDMRRRLRVFSMEVTQDLVISGETMVAPSRFLSVRRAYIPGYQALDYLTPEALVEKLALLPASDRPTAFTLEGREDLLPVLRFAPIPDQSYTLRLTYLADPALLDDEDCNAILDNFPDAYHYGCLSHLGDHARNKERLPEWQSRFDAILADIIGADLRDKVDGSTLVPRVPHRLA